MLEYGYALWIHILDKGSFFLKSQCLGPPPGNSDSSGQGDYDVQLGLRTKVPAPPTAHQKEPTHIALTGQGRNSLQQTAEKAVQVTHDYISILS